MLVQLSQRPRTIAWFFIFLIYAECLLTPVIAKAGIPYPHLYAFKGGLPVEKKATGLIKPVDRSPLKTHVPSTDFAENSDAKSVQAAQPESGGPTQPEMTAFSSVGSGNMVDLFSGDFSYSIPLLDVGGYPLALGYNAGVTMDQEASWVGLGWNVNPGSITRNLRGLPDDFKGDTVTKTISIKENKTVGVNIGADAEIMGAPLLRNFGVTLGITYNNYRGWGMEHGFNVGLNLAKAGSGSLTGGLSYSNSSMNGLTVSPSINFGSTLINDNSAVSIGGKLPYNSRTGLASLQLSSGLSYSKQVESKSGKSNVSGYGSLGSTLISFYSPSVMPTINIPYTSRQFSFSAKVGFEQKVITNSLSTSGFVSKQYVADKDTTTHIPAYGYLNYQHAAKNGSSLLDYNREKELPFREKPAYPHIAVPSYTYDAFSISGEGIGGMFRGYRSEVGFVHDNAMRTYSSSERYDLDIALGPDIAHGGFGIGPSTSTTRTGPWLSDNRMADSVRFRNSKGLFEAAYFRNPGEKSINTKEYYQSLGGDDLVAIELEQRNSRDASIVASSILTRYRNGLAQQVKDSITSINAIRQSRNKRTQVVSYLNAREADATALNKYIENYSFNVFDPSICGNPESSPEGTGTGLNMELFGNMELEGTPALTWHGSDELHLELTNGYPKDLPAGVVNDERFSIRWTGRMRAPVTGKYEFRAKSDDGFYFKVNGVSVIDNWKASNFDAGFTYGTLNLEAGQFYEIEAAMYDNKKYAGVQLDWQYPGASYHKIPKAMLYPHAIDTFRLNSVSAPSRLLMVKEKRVNEFRKAHHLSEISVLNNDGKRYVYGIPVYNLVQKDVTFSVDGRNKGNMKKGMVGYRYDAQQNDASTRNKQGKENYFSKEEMPAYSHSFLLTSILSDDYSDLTGNGITEDDPGNAVKFNYSKICGVRNPFRWRTPAGKDSASFSEGLRTDYRDDKGTYIYGEKELWYLHSIESKTMIATFILGNRKDMPAVTESGERIDDGSAKRLEKIILYNKADFARHGVAARPVKTVHFDYSYELCRDAMNGDSGKLTLKKVWFTYNGMKRDSSLSNPYRFRYHQNNPRYSTQHSDRWGTYKNPGQNPASIVSDTIRNAEYPYALQDSAMAAWNAGAWNLDGIDLPSGGSLKIDYESDDYGYVQNRQAMQMFQIAGFSYSSSYNTASPYMYTASQPGDYRYVFIKVPVSGADAKDVYNKYLAGIEKLFFKVSVKVPKDNYNAGQTHEYVTCYALLDGGAGAYGVAAPGVIWVRLKGMSLDAGSGGIYSPLVIAATQFLKQNLPSKAWPGSETGDELDLAEAINVLGSQVMNIVELLNGFERLARQRGWVQQADLRRSFVRLLNPARKKYGGGHRVKRVTLFDNWDKMTNQRAAKYGQEYIYTTDDKINDVQSIVSSGVANYEPAIGGEENPFHMPIEFMDQPSVLLPSARGYTEEPLGESFFPSPGVGYSRVRVRTINHLKKKSANGFAETSFYTSKDFPVFTERTIFDASTFKRFKPAITNFLRIMAFQYLTLSQGFKVELNDMHGKLRSQASYPETDHKNYTSYVEYFYRSENVTGGKRLKNTVMTINPEGIIDSSAIIGKDMELMMDMREQESISQTINFEPNSDMFSAGPLFALILTALNFFQNETTRYRSAATVKVINRYGILDSVVAIDKGSRISTTDLLYDSETGDVVLTRTQNEFEDYIYNFNFPSHWAYKSMGPAYRNIDATAEHVTIRDGKIISGAEDALNLFTSGDEILVAGKQKTGGVSCAEEIASFPNYNRIWCIDSSELNGGTRALYFIDRNGKPYSAFDISMKVVRSGRKNIFAAVGSISSLENPIRKEQPSGNYKLVIDNQTKVLAAAANEFNQAWKVQNIFLQKESIDLFAPDSLINLIKRYRRDQHPYRVSAEHYLNDAAWVNSPYFRMVNKSTSFADGIFKWPDTIRNAGTFESWWLYSNILANNSSFCAGNGFAVEGNVRLLKDNFQPTVENFTISIDNNFALVLYKSSHPDNPYRGLSLTRIMAKPHPDSPANYNLLQGATYLIDTAPSFLSKRWHKFKVQLTSSEVIFNWNGVEICRANRPPAMVSGNFPGVRIGFMGSQGVIDSVKLFNESNVEMLNETYDDPVQRALVNPAMLCPTPSFNCQTSFATYFNQQKGTSFTYSQIDSLYYSRTCSYMDVCTSTPPSGNPSIPCGPVVGKECVGVVADTSFNPYVTGALGNWRANRALTFYAPRNESDPAVATNIRQDGTLSQFTSYWNFQDGALKPSSDTIKWVWNSVATMFNKKGAELENKDPLGRYNSGMYGYDLTLPVAVTQNSRYRESSFEGFEDYHMSTNNCSDVCPATRHADWSGYAASMDTVEKHSGKRSLRLAPSAQAGITTRLWPESKDNELAKLKVVTLTGACGGTVLKEIRADSALLLPGFVPTPGKSMVVSAWVKEAQDCKCTSYLNSKIIVVAKNAANVQTTYQFTPSGNIIDGWQRIEGVFQIPADAVSFTVNMQATGTPVVYFDDLRIHPFNANMKSFVYHPVNLRLMAELDENNYASFYEYDDEGTLIRVKKETVNGIKTIKETRSAMAQ